MGQQQLLLIIVGVLIVAIGIVVGLQMFAAGSITANRDSMVNDINIIASSAQQHYVRPISLGGGAGTFNGYNPPERLRRTGNGEYRVDGDGNVLEIVGESVQHENVVINLTLTISEDGWQYVWDWEHEGL
jgi:hypothetical protein